MLTFLLFQPVWFVSSLVYLVSLHQGPLEQMDDLGQIENGIPDGHAHSVGTVVGRREDPIGQVMVRKVAVRSHGNERRHFLFLSDRFLITLRFGQAPDNDCLRVVEKKIGNY